VSDANWPDLPIDDLRAQVAGKPARGLEQLGWTSRRSEEDLTASLNDLLTGRWTWGGEELRFETAIRWTGYSRSFEFRLHAWEPLLRLAGGFEQTGNATFYEALKGFAFDWLDAIQAPMLERGLEAAAAAGDAEMAWYDMAVALRAYRLAWFCDVIARDETVADNRFELALRALYFHLSVLAREDGFSSHSNHGLYQAMGQFTAARRHADLPLVEAYRLQGRERLQAVLDAQISKEGVHREHSPGYHQMLLGTLLGARQAGLFEDILFPPDLIKMQEALSWMTAPDFTLAPIGDTDPVLAGDNLGPPAALEHAQLTWQVSRGGGGSPPPDGAGAYLADGYAFGRLLSEGENDPHRAAWLAQIAGFHSRTHKHADHGGFVWHDRGRAILTDPGRYDYGERTPAGSPEALAGNWYADPRRVYVEATRAHNCVEIDGADYPRAKARPFGSGLVYAGVQSGGFVSECEFRHGDVRHRRVLFMKPGQYLLALDWLVDSKDAAHDFRQYFTLAPNWLAECRRGGYGLSDTLAPSQDLVVCSLVGDVEVEAPQVGATKPRLAGWVSPGPRKFVPAASLCLTARARPKALFCTLFAFGQSVEATAEPQVSPTFTGAKLAWTLDGRSHRLRVARGGGDQISVTALRI
jgi:hypothetical protein